MVWRQREARLKWFGHVQRRDGAENGAVRQEEKDQRDDSLIY